MHIRIILFAGIAVLLAIYLWTAYPAWFGHGAPAATSTIATTTATSTPPQAQGVQPALGNHAGLTYGAAVRFFGERRMQFDENCVATPNSIVIKSGLSFMFDNRSPQPMSFALDGRRNYLRSYDFTVLLLSSSRLPHTVVVDCGSGKNSAQIILN